MAKNSICKICGKHRYATEEAANRVIALSGEKRRETRAYYVHGWWHITSREDEKPKSA